MKDSRLYFAYGDNMNEDVVRATCPGVSYEGIAELRGHSFTFNDQGKITVSEDKGASIWGVVWCLSMRDIHLLDQKEAEVLGAFEKLTKHLHFLDGREADAFLYTTDIGGQASYSRNLMELIIEQAYYWSLPSSYIEFLKSLRDKNK